MHHRSGDAPPVPCGAKVWSNALALTPEVVKRVGADAKNEMV